MFHRLSRGSNRYGLSSQRDRSCIRGRDSEKDASQFRAARADDSGKTDDLTGAQIEIDIVNAGFFAAEPSHGKCDARQEKSPREGRGWRLPFRPSA